jgi:hypothetical protein
MIYLVLISSMQAQFHLFEQLCNNYQYNTPDITNILTFEYPKRIFDAALTRSIGEI